MFLYAHLALAHIAAVRLQPAFLDEFAWGAIIPDIYRLAGMERSQTHLKKQTMEGVIKGYPEQRSFVQGYRVHLLLDEIDLVKSIRLTFPVIQSKPIFSQYFARYLSESNLKLLVEDYFLGSNLHQRLSAVSGKQNDILTKLGICQDMVEAYAARAQAYLYKRPIKNRSVQNLETELNDLYAIRDDICTYRQLRRNPLLYSILTLAVKNAGLERIAMGLI